MSFGVIIKEEALNDIQEAYEYYEFKQLGLGEKFLQKIEQRLLHLSKHPHNYSFINEDYLKILRDVKIEKFPFVIVFEIEDNTVIVYAIHNCYKLPSKKKRNK
jgi:hypothetical protein